MLCAGGAVAGRTDGGDVTSKRTATAELVQRVLSGIWANHYLKVFANARRSHHNVTFGVRLEKLGYPDFLGRGA